MPSIRRDDKVADEDRTQDDDFTNAEPASEDENSGDHSRDHACSLPGGKKETWIEKNKRAPIIGGWRQVDYTAYAVVSPTHVYKLSRDSPLASGYEALTVRSERVAYLKRHGEVKLRSEVFPE